MNSRDDWLTPLKKKVDEDDPKNWKPCNRDLTPAERMYSWQAKVHTLEDDHES